MIKILIVYTGKGELAKYATHLSAGMDLRANIPLSITLQPLERTIIPTGLSISLPEGYEAQVRPRSGLAAKYGVTVLNSPGTIDADYRGDIGVIMVNLSQEPFTILPEDRIAQLVVAKYSRIKWELAESLPDSIRGEGGFGSTGKK